jgi:hypothetical protein
VTPEIEIRFSIGERPYSVRIDAITKRIVGIDFHGYDACRRSYPEGPFADDAQAVAEALFSVWLSRQ